MLVDGVRRHHYGIDERKLRLAMKVGSSYDVFQRRDTWPGAARDLGLDAAALRDRVAELARILPDAFADAARAPGVSALGSDLPGRLTGLIADRAQRCAELRRAIA